MGLINLSKLKKITLIIAKINREKWGDIIFQKISQLLFGLLLRKESQFKEDLLIKLYSNVQILNHPIKVVIEDSSMLLNNFIALLIVGQEGGHLFKMFNRQAPQGIQITANRTGYKKIRSA